MAINEKGKLHKATKRIFTLAFKTITALVMAAILTAGALSLEVHAYSNPDFFLKQGVGARQLGMGNAGTAVADDASSVFFNPAGLAYLKNVEITSMHSEAYDFDIKYDYLTLALPIIHGRVIGISGAVLKTDQIPITKDKIPNIVNYVEDKEQVTMLSYGHKISRHASLGFTYKDIKQELYFKEAKGQELDLGFLYNPSQTVSFGVNVQDILPGELKWSTGVNDAIPITIRGGLALKLRDWGSIIAVDADRVEGRKVKFNGGWEYQFNETFIGRVGINDGQGTAGFSIAKGGWRFDYAYMKADLGEVQRFSGTTRFGSYLFENLWKRYKRPRTPQCGEMKLKNNAVCDKTKTVNGESTVCASANPNSKIASYPTASGKRDAGQMVKLGGADSAVMSSVNASGTSYSGKPLARNVSVTAAQPDINKVLEKDNSPVVQLPAKASASRLPDQKIVEGNKLVLAGRYDEAAKAYREALNMKPDLEAAHVKLAGIYQYQKLYSEAIEEYKDAIAINPSNPDNYISVSSLYAKIGEFDKASEACEIVIRMAPGSTKAKIAQNLYETFKRQAAPPDNKLLLRADNIQSLNYEESESSELKLDISSEPKSGKKKKSAKKSSSASKKSKSETKKVASAKISQTSILEE